MKTLLKEMLNDILGVDFRYPVGSYYETSDANFNPNTAWGGTWVLEDEGRVLQATQVAANVGTTKEAGLPNITGTFAVNASNGTTFGGLMANGITETTGAFGGVYSSYQQVFFPKDNVISTTASRMGNIDASRSSSVYGNSDTVQPKARLVHVWHRTA